MARKKYLKVPEEKWYPWFNLETGKEEEITNIKDGNKVIVRVADIVANPVLAERNFSSYHGDADLSPEDVLVYHFTEYNCEWNKKEFKSHNCLCIHKGKEDWHKPGQCKHLHYWKGEE